jgi:hypothetical protein
MTVKDKHIKRKTKYPTAPQILPYPFPQVNVKLKLSVRYIKHHDM